MNKKSIKRSNPVAKYARKFNRAATHMDRKKEVKKRGVRERMNIDIDIFDCLIDTVERTTDLEGVYNDKTGKFFTWEEIHKAREEN